MHGVDDITTPNFWSQVNAESICGPQVDTLISYRRLQCPNLIRLALGEGPYFYLSSLIFVLVVDSPQEVVVADLAVVVVLDGPEELLHLSVVQTLALVPDQVLQDVLVQESRPGSVEHRDGVDQLFLEWTSHLVSGSTQSFFKEG